MRSTIFAITLSVLVTWSCEQQPTQQKQQEQQQQQQQLKYHNISIMQNVIDSDMPLLLKNSIAACCSIIREYYVPSSNNFMLSVNVRERHLKWHAKDFINNVLLNLTLLKVEIESASMAIRERSYNRKYNLIVVDSYEALRELDPANFTQHYDIQEYYVLYFMHANRFSNITEVLDEIFAYFWQNSIINVSLMRTNIDRALEVLTYFPYDNYLNCEKPVVKVVNLYSGYWMNSIDEIFPEKIVNLNGCPLYAAVWNTPPYFSFKENENGLYEIEYFEAELLKVLAGKLNFSLILLEPPNNEQRGRVLENGTVTGAMKMLIEDTADLSLGSFRYSLERSNLLTAALPYYQTYQTYGIMKATQLYTSLEILLYPFDIITWICILLSVIFGMIVSFTVIFFYDKSILVQIAVGYPRMRTPMQDIIRMFLGQPLLDIPHTNLARSALILWHIYGLLMRTAYQALLFQLLKLNVYHEPPQSLTDLIDNDCSLVMSVTTYETVFTVPRIGSGLVNVIQLENASETSPYVYLEEDTTKRCLAAVSPTDYLTYHVIKEGKRGVYYVLPEKIFTQHVTMYFMKHSCFINRFNELLMSLRSMGLINFWALKSLDIGYLTGPRESEYKPVKIDDLNGILMICGVLNLVGVIVFCLEILYYHLKIIIYGRQYPFIH